jgi:hypothetical protein
LSLPRELIRCSRAPEIRRIDYWKLKGQALPLSQPL